MKIGNIYLDLTSDKNHPVFIKIKEIGEKGHKFSPQFIYYDSTQWDPPYYMTIDQLKREFKLKRKAIKIGWCTSTKYQYNWDKNRWEEQIKKLKGVK